MSKYYAKDPATGEYASITWPALRQGTQPQRSWYYVHVGQTRIGIVALLAPDGWDAISTAGTSRLCGLRRVSGFRTRWGATEYLLRAYGIWTNE